MTEADLARLALSSLPSFGPSKVRRSFSTSIDPKLSADEAIEELVRELSGGSDPFSLADLSAAISNARRTVDASDNLGIDIFAMSDPRYPEPLKRIPTPPPFLHVKGVLPENWSNAVAVIGTREISQAAVSAIDEMVNALSSCRDVIVVSGLALGADAKAHEASLRCGLRTAAVLAHGLDQPIYPRPNADLAQRILNDGGCWISELRVGEKIAPYNLVARDRLQSGLAFATIVAQTSVSGGSMHTALFTLQQKRILIALQPPISQTDQPEWLGNAFLTSQSITPAGVKKADEFAKHRRPYARLLPRDKIAAWIERGLQARFIPIDRGDRKAATAVKGLPGQGLLFDKTKENGSPSAVIAPVAVERIGRAQESVSLDLSSNNSSFVVNNALLAPEKMTAMVAGPNETYITSNRPDSGGRDVDLQLVHAGQITLRPGHSVHPDLARGSGVRVSDTVAFSHTLSESLAGLGIKVNLSSNEDGCLSRLDVSFQSAVEPDAAIALLRLTLAIVSAVCLTKWHEQLCDASLDLFDEKSNPICYERGQSAEVATRAVVARDFAIPMVLLDLFAQFDDVLRMSSGLGGFLAAYALVEQLLGLWKRLDISAKRLKKQKDIKLPEIRLRDVIKLDATFSGRRYSDLVRHYKPLVKAAKGAEPSDLANARRVFESVLPRLIDTTKSAFHKLEEAGGSIEDLTAAGVASANESLTIALPLAKSLA